LTYGVCLRYNCCLAYEIGGSMNARRLFAAAALATLPLSLSALPAGATPPIGNCPPAFQGPHTFAEIIATWPPPPGFPDPEGALAGYDLNGDGSLCVLPLPGGTNINVIDNTAMVP
jgi:hypothetical protein